MLEKELRQKLISAGRAFTRGFLDNDSYRELSESDQEQKLPQPPLVKAAYTPLETHIPLTKDFTTLNLKQDIIELIRDRKSSRIYTQESMSLDELSFMLWSTQGIKGLRGKSYATLRTVPCGGARHEFETYLIVRNIEGLKQGAYHYLPMEHALEYLHPIDHIEDTINETLCGQVWASKANVVFYWSMVPYRAEWRYDIYAHRTALIDTGHIGQNLYLACTALERGCCGIAAFSHERCNEVFCLDGEDEYIVYTVPVGSIRDSDKIYENAFYSFIEE